MPPVVRLRSLPTDALADDEVRALRAMLDAAFWGDPDERFTDDDWHHAIGGTHVVLDVDGEIVAHASVVPRVLHVAGVPLRTGYVEAVATAPGRQGSGYGTAVMQEIGDHIRARFEIGALGTGRPTFYERLGWRTWQGPTSVRADDGERPTPDEDGLIMILSTPSSPDLDLNDPISADWRPGDAW